MNKEHSPNREWYKRDTPRDDGKDALLLGQRVVLEEIVFVLGHVVEVYVFDGGGTVGAIP